MRRFGEKPYLECSSKGDKRFSAFHAKIYIPGTGEYHSIESLYQAKKVFEDGSTGLHWREAKGKKPVNIEECREFYSHCWDVYFRQNPDLLDVIKKYRGFSDIFGQEGSACQAEEIYRIRMPLGFN